MADYPKPLPVVNEDTREYWASCQRHELVIQRCRACGRFQFYPRGICSHCCSEDLEWAKAAGKGQVYSYSVVHRPPSKAFAPDVPYVVAIVELAEGVRMMTNIVDCPPEAVRIGMPVEVMFQDVTAEITLPQFRPIGAAQGART